ncbi:PqqD family protein [Methylocystis sp. IM3]|uniref:PqqD family protein n=1 Tax=unclassified Methylocystis TaxID=2625913 RepID=UPI0031194F8E
MDPAARIRQANNQVSCDLDEETVILHLENSLYYGTDRVGACIWEALRRPARIDEICAAVMERFEVDEDRCRADVAKFLDRLRAAGLLDVIA